MEIHEADDAEMWARTFAREFERRDEWRDRYASKLAKAQEMLSGLGEGFVRAMREQGLDVSVLGPDVAGSRPRDVSVLLGIFHDHGLPSGHGVAYLFECPAPDAVRVPEDLGFGFDVMAAAGRLPSASGSGRTLISDEAELVASAQGATDSFGAVMERLIHWKRAIRPERDRTPSPSA